MSTYCQVCGEEGQEFSDGESHQKKTRCEQCGRLCCEHCISDMNDMDEDDRRLYNLFLTNDDVCNECLGDDNPVITERSSYIVVYKCVYVKKEKTPLKVSPDLLKILKVDNIYSLRDILDPLNVRFDSYLLNDELKEYFGIKETITKKEFINLLCNELDKGYSKGANLKA